MNESFYLKGSSQYSFSFDIYILLQIFGPIFTSDWINNMSRSEIVQKMKFHMNQQSP